MKIVLYGAGRRGRVCYKLLRAYGYGNVVYGFCDKNADTIKEYEDKKVWSVEDLQDMDDIRYCITIKDVEEKKKIRNELGGKRCMEFEEMPELIGIDKVKFNRDFCALIHDVNMNDYFEIVESEEKLAIFWDENSVFNKMFKELDTSNIIELACGRGRHVQKYLDKAGMITLVDILEKNIDICKERFGNIEKVKFYQNDGYDLEKLRENTYTSLFSYDAMVHFELLDIYEYLKDIYRVLKGGGRALLHHSNNHVDYKASFSNAVAGRSFMSKECFAYFANRAGFIVLEQKVIDWNGEKDLDCITLLEKPREALLV